MPRPPISRSSRDTSGIRRFRAEGIERHPVVGNGHGQAFAGQLHFDLDIVLIVIAVSVRDDVFQKLLKDEFELHGDWRRNVAFLREGFECIVDGGNFGAVVLDRDPLFGPQRLFRPAVELQCQDGNVVGLLGLSLERPDRGHRMIHRRLHIF